MIQPSIAMDSTGEALAAKLQQGVPLLTAERLRPTSDDSLTISTRMRAIYIYCNLRRAAETAIATSRRDRDGIFILRPTSDGAKET